MRHLMSLLLVTALSACGGAAKFGSREDAVRDASTRIPIEAVKTSPAAREAMRQAGRPVMLVAGRPGYLYWDYVARDDVDQPGYKVPQEGTDVQGCVIVSYDIRPDGRTDGFEIDRSTPPGVFDKAALRAAYATEYEPPAAAVPRQRRALWFLIARSPRPEPSWMNESIEAEHNRRRDAQRAACEGQIL
jgi:TonB family protein